MLPFTADAAPHRPKLGKYIFTGSPTIVGGSPAPKGTFPWQLSMQIADNIYFWLHWCGAVLVKTNKALTAAHCTDDW